MGILGPGKKEAWSEFAEKMGAEIVDAGAFKGGLKVRLPYKNWEVVMDTYTVSTGNGTVTYTRVRAVYVRGKEFSFKVFRTSFLTKIVNAFGRQSAKTGNAAFDSQFTIRSHQEGLVQEIFKNEKLKQTLSSLKRVNFFVKKAKGRKETKYIENENEIHYYMTGVIRDIDKLTFIFGIILDLLNEFEAHGIAKSEAPKISYIA